MSANIFQKLAFAATTTVVICGLTNTNPAQAAQFVYDFSGSNNTQRSFNFKVDGLTATATGYSQIGHARVRQSNAGLGIRSSFLDTDKREIDGFGLKESLLLNFTTNVRLLSATFGRVGYGDEFRLFVDGNRLISANIPGGNIWDRDIGTFNFDHLSGTTGSEFRFTVTDKWDDYTLKRAVFQVPEPGAILGLLTVAALSTGSALKHKHKSVV